MLKTLIFGTYVLIQAGFWLQYVRAFILKLSIKYIELYDKYTQAC